MTEAGKARRPPARKASRAGREPGQAAASAKSSPSSASSAPDPIDADNLDEAFVKTLEADFIANGKSAIIALRREKPVEYMEIVAALRTRDVKDAVDPLGEMGDAELDRYIEKLAAEAGYEIRPAAAPRRDGAAPEEGDPD